MAHRRLMKEYGLIQKNPIPHVACRPDTKNVFLWHFLIFGPSDSVFAGGEYYGTINFPAQYPHSAPEIRLFTPSGRFESGAKICLSYTSYHRETWSPGWTVSTMLLGLLSFMLKKPFPQGVFDQQLKPRKIVQENQDRTMKRKKYDQHLGDLLAIYRKKYPSSSSVSLEVKPKEDSSSPKEGQMVSFYLYLAAIFVAIIFAFYCSI